MDRCPNIPGPASVRVTDRVAGTQPSPESRLGHVVGPGREGDTLSLSSDARVANLEAQLTEE